jgi:hypothetical protein
MTDLDRTLVDRPVPKRPKWGWLAWEASVGYIHQNHSPDATLKLEIYPMEFIMGWAASLSWGEWSEAVRDQHSFADSLNNLWALVEQNHDLINSLEAAVRRPVKYEDDDWLDELTYEAFSRLINTTDTIFQGDWQIVILYRPIEIANKRVQTRLIADGAVVNRSGSGATLRDACRQLFHNAAPIYQQYRKRGN